MFYWKKVKTNVGWDFILYLKLNGTLQYFCPDRGAWVESIRTDTKDLILIKNL